MFKAINSVQPILRRQVQFVLRNPTPRSRLHVKFHPNESFRGLKAQALRSEHCENLHQFVSFHFQEQNRTIALLVSNDLSNVLSVQIFKYVADVFL